MTITQSQTKITEGVVGSFEITVLDGNKPRVYEICFTGRYVRVVTGNATKFRFGGKVFHNDAEIETHYKKDGKTILEAITAARIETGISHK